MHTRQPSHHDTAGPFLTSSERARLLGVLGMLGSAHDGERAAAGLLASRLLNAKGLAWSDVVVPAPVASETTPWRQQAAEAARYAGLLTPWERDFLRKLGAFPQLSDKQMEVLQRILCKVHGAS